MEESLVFKVASGVGVGEGVFVFIELRNVSWRID